MKELRAVSVVGSCPLQVVICVDERMPSEITAWSEHVWMLKKKLSSQNSPSGMGIYPKSRQNHTHLVKQC